MTVAEAQSRIAPGEFREWVSFFALEPWGSRTEDLRAGKIVLALASAFGGKRSRSLSVDDVFPPPEARLRRALPRAELVRRLAAGARAAGGRVR